MKRKSKLAVSLQKGFISLSLLGIGVLVISAIALLLVTKLAGNRVTTQQRAAETYRCPKPDAPTLKLPAEVAFPFESGKTKVVTEVNPLTNFCADSSVQYSFWARFDRDDGTWVVWEKAYSTSTTFTHGPFYKTGRVTWKARARYLRNGSDVGESPWSGTRIYRVGGRIPK